MKGNINKTNYGWVVRWTHPFDSNGSVHELSLHPSDIRMIDDMKRVFDNFEARIISNPQVEFEFSFSDDGSQCAKLKI